MTNERITYTATMPDGTTDTRTSPTMEYTHAVIGEHPVHGWIACSWHTSEALAHKAVNSRYTSSAKRRVVAVTDEPATKKGKAARAARIAEIEAETDVNVLITIVDQGKAWERVAARLRRTELEAAPVADWSQVDAAQVCTGEWYPINPDAPEEGEDVRHAGPCPAHPEAERAAEGEAYEARRAAIPADIDRLMQAAIREEVRRFPHDAPTVADVIGSMYVLADDPASLDDWADAIEARLADLVMP